MVEDHILKHLCNRGGGGPGGPYAGAGNGLRKISGGTGGGDGAHHQQWIWW